ncbi:nucleoside hydrolase [Actinocatenispora sera]|uniref:nucleoside hydrolase n=1 Tax=Actinocatenispora sera TaxID=390989 RepID=UPI0033C6DC75
MTHRVVLDTDIGSDVDDALALAVLLGSPEVDLVGVTTVYGDTALRARLAARLARLAGREVVAVAGQREPLSGRDVWWAGHEGGSFDDLGDEPISAGDGVDFLVDTVRSAPGEIDLVAIGPLTNVAAAVRADPRFAGTLRHLYVMGGRFGHAPDGGPGPRTAEHNFRSDATAAHLVHAAGIRSTTTGLDVTTTVRLGRAAVDRIGAAGALGAALRAEPAVVAVHRRAGQRPARPGDGTDDAGARPVRVCPRHRVGRRRRRLQYLHRRYRSGAGRHRGRRRYRSDDHDRPHRHRRSVAGLGPPLVAPL